MRLPTLATSTRPLSPQDTPASLGSGRAPSTRSRAGLPFIWSPSAPESPRRGLNTSADYARTLAESLRTVSAAALLSNITIQDSVGKASNVSLAQRTIRYGVGCDDAVWHANITRSALGDSVDVSINMESFLRAGQRPLHIVDLPADPRETELREACYARQGCDSARAGRRDTGTGNSQRSGLCKS